MTEQHPITPPPEELVQEWSDEWYRLKVKINTGIPEYVATQAARWGADQELEACCEWLREARNHGFGYDMGRILADNLRAARRPKPPSLAEQALAELDQIPTHDNEGRTVGGDASIIRAALERLRELENND